MLCFFCDSPALHPYEYEKHLLYQCPKFNLFKEFVGCLEVYLRKAAHLSLTCLSCSAGFRFFALGAIDGVQLLVW